MPGPRRKSTTPSNDPPTPPRRAPQGAAKGDRPARPCVVVVVEEKPALADAVRQRLGPDATIVHAHGVAEAREVIARAHADVALIDATLPDGKGLDLARQLQQSPNHPQTILVDDAPSLDTAITALRLGAADLLTKPLDLDALDVSVRAAILRHRQALAHTRRLRRLRRIVRKLNDARLQITKQVDTLCGDLVTAYQDLASQVQHVCQTTELNTLLRDELDLEQVLRRTLEFLVGRAGPTNAALFLPSSLDEFTLGGYVNYDCQSDSADVLLEHMADVVAPKVAEREPLLHITDNDTLAEWIGDDGAYFADSHVVAFACRHKGEVLAVIVLFRDAGDPFPAELIETCNAAAPMLAEYLARIIRIHHRMADPPEDTAYGHGDEVPF